LDNHVYSAKKSKNTVTILVYTNRARFRSHCTFFLKHETFHSDSLFEGIKFDFSPGPKTMPKREHIIYRWIGNFMYIPKKDYLIS